MWLYGTMQSNKELYKEFPFLPISQLAYMPRPLSWRRYPHIHPKEYEFSYILNGQGLLYLPGTEYRLGRGNIILVPPGTAHYFVSEGTQELEYFALRIFNEETGGPALSRMECLGCCAAAGSHFECLKNLLFTVMELAKQNSNVIDRPIQIISLAIWELTMQDLAQTGYSLTLSAPEYANDILCYLQEHLQKKITLQDLAEQFHLSASHISRVFSRTYHISPINYLIMSRMARARTYILEDHLPAAEIAKRLAYGDTYQFITAFTRFFGCRPDEYYAMVKKTEE